MIFLVVALTGTAMPRPTPATAVLIPTTRALASAGARRKLPGLGGAAVWMTSSIPRPRAGRDQPSALTTPAVTDPASPSGLPTATTSWPTLSWSASPTSAGAGVGPCARSTARSDSGSAPTTRNGADVPSENSAVPPVDLPTTWAFVSRNPSPVKTTPEPRLSPRPYPPPCPPRGTRRLATLDVSRSATPETICEYESRGLLCAGMRSGPLTGLVLGVVSSIVSPSHSRNDYRITL